MFFFVFGFFVLVKSYPKLTSLVYLVPMPIAHRPSPIAVPLEAVADMKTESLDQGPAPGKTNLKMSRKQGPNRLILIEKLTAFHCILIQKQDSICGFVILPRARLKNKHK